MMRRRRLLEGVLCATELDTELQPNVPVVEIAGEHRVLIENHRSVITYTDQQVTVKVKFGQIHVKGDRLKLVKLGKEQLVITGEINCVMLCRRAQ